MSNDITRWLEEIGLGEHAESFVENDIDFHLLPRLSTEDLKELGLSVGHRRRFLDAVAKLKETPSEGAGISSPTAPHGEAERRQLTVMFCDLVGSTELSQKLDAEDLREVNRAYQDTCKAAIDRYEGYIARYMGDGVLAYFGYPQAHENDAERAIHAGLGVVAAMADLSEPRGHMQGEEVRVRVGIATGPVVVGDIVGEGASQENAVVGETPNLAARLQSLSTPNTVLISPNTHRLAGAQFHCEGLGEHSIRGIAEPIEVWRVTGPRPWSSRFEAHGKVRTRRLVGREQELALLLDRWSQAKEGEGQVVLLAGEPGIGKSRITDTVLERTAPDAPLRLIYQCSPYHTHSAFYPVITQIEHAAGFTEDDSPDARLDKLESLLAPSVGSVEVDRPLLAGLLSIPWEHRYEPVDLMPEARREETLKALVRQLDGLFRDHPMAMLFEDVHWADATSLDFLDRIINWAQRTRVLVLITFRPEFLVPWRHYSHVTSLTLSRFTRKLAAAMVAEVVGDRKLSDSIRDQIVAKTDGIPLFVEELTQAVVESQEFQSGTGGAQQGLGLSLAIPDTLQDSLAARLDRIGPAKEVVQVGAVIGREFSHELVASLGGFSDETVGNALETALESGVVFRRGAPPEATYTFKHALVRDAAYEMLLNRRRRQLHGRLGDLFESRTRRGGSEIQPELLAHHFTEAGRVELAVAYWSKAGKAAIDRYANVEAVGHLRKGLELLAQLAEGPVRDQRELDLLIGLGHGLQGSAGSAVSETGAAYRRAQTLARQTGDPQQQSEILQGLRMFHLTRGELSAAREVGEELLSLGERLQDTGLLMEGHRAVGGVLLHIGELVLARTHLEATYALYDAVEHRRHAVQYDTDPGVTALQYLSQVLWTLGFPQQARARAEQAVTLARASSHPLSLVEALFWDAELGRYLYDLQHVCERVEEEISLATEHNLQMWICLARYQHGWAMVHQGEPETGITRMRRSFTAVLSLEHGLISLWVAPLVEAYEKAGLVEEGLAAADEGLETFERAGGSLHESELYRLKGKLLLARGEHVTETEACLRRALEVARRQGAKSYELRAATNMARILRDREERREARDLLAPVYDWFTEGFDTPDLCEAKTLLEKLS